MNAAFFAHAEAAETWRPDSMIRREPVGGFARRARRPLWLALCVMLAGCGRAPDPANPPQVAVTTSYLEAVLYDLLPQGVRVMRLAEPGACPGHFDLRASQAAEIRRCQALFRFDFQQGLDAKLTGGGARPPRLGAIAVPGGMCEPGSYRAACRQVADHLIALGFLSHAQAAARQRAIEARLEALSREVAQEITQAGLSNTPVVASVHQRDFCAWLGLKVVATFRGADTASVGRIQEALDRGRTAGAKLVMANRPEGRRTAEALADRLGARVVVFENFPQAQPGRAAFDEMVRANVRTLLAASGS